MGVAGMCATKEAGGRTALTPFFTPFESIFNAVSTHFNAIQRCLYAVLTQFEAI